LNVCFSRRKGIFLATLLFILAVLCLPSFADTIKSQELTSDVLFYQHDGGDVLSMDISECTDVMPGGGTKFCLCQGMAFRVSQLMADKWKDGVFHVDDVKVVTGWKTDGPKELFVEALGMAEGKDSGFSYDDEARAGKDQYTEDSWYEVTVLSTGIQYLFCATDEIYDVVSDDTQPDFLDYRREIKSGDSTHKTEMQNLRALVQARIEADPFVEGSFWILEEPVSDGVDHEVYSDDLRYEKSDGSIGVVHSSDCYESNGAGVTKFCLCQAVAFRVSQMMTPAWADGIFHPQDVTVSTSWNTHGPIEFFVEQLGVASDDLTICGHASDGSLDPSVEAPSGRDLTLADSIYEIRVKSTGREYVFQGTSRLYTGEFLAYRSEIKNGDKTHQAEMGTLRKEVQANLVNTPFAGMISASRTSRGSSSGGCNISAFGPSAALLSLPLILLLKK